MLSRSGVPDDDAQIAAADRIVGRAAFTQSSDAWLDRYLAASGPNARYPGQRQAESEARLAQQGIPLPATVANELQQTGERVGVTFDVATQAA